MSRIISPSVETTKDFILIKIPRNLVSGSFPYGRQMSELEHGLQESLREAAAGKLVGPFRSGKKFLGVLRSRKK